MANNRAPRKGEAALAAVAATAILVAAIVAVRNPGLEFVSTLVAGVAVQVVIFAPYVPGADVPMTASLVGVVVVSVGVYGILTDSIDPALFWILALGGIGLVLEDQYRRRGSGTERVGDGTRRKRD